MAVSQGNLSLKIEEKAIVVQAKPFSDGQTVVVPVHRCGKSRRNPGIGLAEVRPGTSLSEVISGWNALGVSPSDMIDILKRLKAGGAQHAECVVR